jgi:hypothetical protein
LPFLIRTARIVAMAERTEGELEKKREEIKTGRASRHWEKAQKDLGGTPGGGRLRTTSLGTMQRAGRISSPRAEFGGDDVSNGST